MVEYPIFYCPACKVEHEFIIVAIELTDDERKAGTIKKAWNCSNCGYKKIKDISFISIK